LGPAATLGRGDSREDAVDVRERPTCTGGEVVPLVQVDSHGVDGRYANDCEHVSMVRRIVASLLTCAIERRNLALQLFEDALDDAHGVQFITVNRRRERELLASLQTLGRSPRDHNRDMDRVPSIEFADAQVVPRDSLRRHIRKVQIMNDFYAVQDIAGEVGCACTAGKDRSGREGRFEKHRRVETCISPLEDPADIL
jgi:hypothetical protein